MRWSAEAPKLVVLLVGIGAFGLVMLALVLADRVSRWWSARRLPRLSRGDGPVAAGFLLVPLLLLGIGLVVPAARTLLLSTMDGPGTRFVGLANYRWMVTAPEAVVVLRNTLLWVVLVPLLATGVGLAYAVLVDRARFESLAKSLIFMPMAISFVGAGIIWNFVYAYRPADAPQMGLLNQVVAGLGGAPQQWLLRQDWAVNTLFLIAVMVWIQAGFAMVLLSAAIKAIPADIVEAARLDGVDRWQMFWRITLPAIRPAVVVVVVTISIATLKIFDVVRTMTGGRFETSVIANEMYDQAFRYGETGRGSALAVVLFLLVLPVLVYQVRSLRLRER